MRVVYRPGNRGMSADEIGHAHDLSQEIATPATCVVVADS